MWQGCRPQVPLASDERFLEAAVGFFGYSLHMVSCGKSGLGRVTAGTRPCRARSEAIWVIWGWSAWVGKSIEFLALPCGFGCRLELAGTSYAPLRSMIFH